MNTLQDEWEKVEHLLVPVDASTGQRKEMRLAFYTGARAMIYMQANMAAQGVSATAGGDMVVGWLDEVRSVVDLMIKDACDREETAKDHRPAIEG